MSALPLYTRAHAEKPTQARRRGARRDVAFFFPASSSHVRHPSGGYSDLRLVEPKSASTNGSPMKSTVPKAWVGPPVSADRMEEARTIAGAMGSRRKGGRCESRAPVDTSQRPGAKGPSDVGAAYRSPQPGLQRAGQRGVAMPLARPRQSLPSSQPTGVPATAVFKAKRSGAGGQSPFRSEAGQSAVGELERLQRQAAAASISDEARLALVSSMSSRAQTAEGLRAAGETPPRTAGSADHLVFRGANVDMLILNQPKGSQPVDTSIAAPDSCQEPKEADRDQTPALEGRLALAESVMRKLYRRTAQLESSLQRERSQRPATAVDGLTSAPTREARGEAVAQSPMTGDVAPETDAPQALNSAAYTMHALRLLADHETKAKDLEQQLAEATSQLQELQERAQAKTPATASSVRASMPAPAMTLSSPRVHRPPARRSNNASPRCRSGCGCTKTAMQSSSVITEPCSAPAPRRSRQRRQTTLTVRPVQSYPSSRTSSPASGRTPLRTTACIQSSSIFKSSSSAIGESHGPTARLPCEASHPHVHIPVARRYVEKRLLEDRVRSLDSELKARDEIEGHIESRIFSLFARLQQLEERNLELEVKQGAIDPAEEELPQAVESDDV